MADNQPIKINDLLMGEIRKSMDEGAAPDSIRQGLRQSNYDDPTIDAYFKAIDAAKAKEAADAEPGPVSKYFSRLGENISGMVQGGMDTGQALWNILQGRANPQKAMEGVQTLKGMYVDPIVQQLQLAKQAHNQGDYNTRDAHLAGAIPLFGPGILGAAQNLTQGAPAEGLADLTTLGFAKYGPEVAGAGWDALYNRVIDPMGRSIYKSGLRRVDPSILENTPATQEAIGNQAYKEQISGYRGTAMDTGLDRIQSWIEQGVKDVTAKARKYPHGAPQTWETMGPIEKLILARKHNVPSQAVPLESQLAEYVEQQTGIPKDLKNFPSDAIPQNYIQRVLGLDPGQSMENWLRVNREFNQMVTDTSAKKGMGEVGEGTPSSNMFNRAMQEGTRDMLRRRSPELAELNDFVSQAVSLHKALSEFAKQDPGKIAHLLPLAAGVGGGALFHALGLSTGSGSLEMMAPIAPFAAATYILRTAFKDPAMLMKIGLQLKNMGRGDLSQALFHTVANAPKFSLAKASESDTNNTRP